MSPTSCQTAPPRNRQARDHANQSVFFQARSQCRPTVLKSLRVGQWRHSLALCIRAVPCPAAGQSLRSCKAGDPEPLTASGTTYAHNHTRTRGAPIPSGSLHKAYRHGFKLVRVLGDDQPRHAAMVAGVYVLAGVSVVQRADVAAPGWHCLAGVHDAGRACPPDPASPDIARQASARAECGIRP